MGSVGDEKKSAPLEDVTNGVGDLEKSTKKSLERPPSYNQPEVLFQLPQLNLDEIPVSETTRSVTRDQVVAHLKFLAVLADLREFVSNSDGLFGLFDSEADKYADSSNDARVRIREKRWAVYTARAVDRYQKWWQTCLPMSRPAVTMKDLEATNYEDIVECETQLLWTVENMPPIGEYSHVPPSSRCITNIRTRCFNGLALSYAQSERLPRRLHPIWEDEHLENRIPLCCRECMHQRSHLGVHRARGDQKAI